MKIYIGIGHDDQEAGPARIYVSRPGEELEPLQHRERHSPDGFNWGYGGSGPADTARSILWDVIGREPEPELYQRFKREYVSSWPMQPGECWRISDREIQTWINR